MCDIQLPDSPIWFVRAEENNQAAGNFLSSGLVHMGWGIGPVGPDDSHGEILSRLRDLYPLRRQETLSKWAREIREFNQDIEVGDAVATYEPRSRLYHLGIIRSLRIPAAPWILQKWQSDHVHRVDWICHVSRDRLPEGFAKPNLDRRSTLHRLSEEASAEMRRLCTK